MLIEIESNVFNPNHITQVINETSGYGCRAYFTDGGDIRFNASQSAIMAAINKAVDDRDPLRAIRQVLFNIEVAIDNRS